MTDDYIERRLNWIEGDRQYQGEEADILRQQRPVVVLGEPGMGKTELLKRLGDNPNTQFVRASAFLRWTSEQIAPGKVLVIDALDEVAAKAEGDPLHNVLKKLAELGRPPFVLSCRSAEWQGASANREIADDYQKSVIEMWFDPIGPNDAAAYLAKHKDGSEADRIIEVLDEQGLSDLYAIPLFLKLLSKLDAIPGSRSQLYELAVRQLRQEHNDGHRNSPLANLSEDEALDAAGAAMAIWLITGKDAISRAAPGTVDPRDLHHADVAALTGGAALLTVMQSNLFKAAERDADRMVPLHKTIAEYLGARWLGHLVDRNQQSRRTAARLLGAISAEGGVPASLRGLHAWLAYFSTSLAPQVIATDPFGVLRYGDAAGLSVEQGRQMLSSLRKREQEDPYFRAGDWRPIKANGLVQMDLQPDLSALLTDRSVGPQLTTLLLETIKSTPVAETLKTEVQGLMSDAKVHRDVRISAIKALAALVHTDIDWPALAGAFVEQDSEVAAELAAAVISNVGIDHFDDTLVASVVIARAGFNLAGKQNNRTRSLGSLYRMGESVSDDRLAAIVDALAGLMLPHYDPANVWSQDQWEARHEIAGFANSLIERLLKVQPEAVTASRLWTWLRAIGRKQAQDRDHQPVIAALLEGNDMLRREVQQLARTERSTPLEFHRWQFHLPYFSSGLQLTNEDVVFYLGDLVERHDPAERDDWRWMVAHFRGQDGVRDDIKTLARPYALGNTELLKFLRAKPSKKVPEWERRQLQRQRRADKKREEGFVKSRAAFAENIDAVKVGELRWMYNSSLAYLGRFHDLEREGLPGDRVIEWLGEDLASAVFEGFESVLHRDDLPNATQIAESYAQSKVWNFIHAMIAGAAERHLSGSGFDDLKPEVLSAITMGVQHSYFDEKSGLKGLQEALETELLKSPDDFEIHLRTKFEPQLRAKLTHVDGLYALARSAEYRPLSTRLAAEWLVTFPDLPAETESELVDCLIRAPDSERGFATAQLKQILASRRAASDLDDERQSIWLAVEYTVDFPSTSSASPSVSSDKRTLLWTFSRWFYRRFNGDPEGLAATPAQLAYLVRTFTPLWPHCERPGGVTSGDKNPWDATDVLNWAIGCLGDDPSDHAVAALTGLRAEVTGPYAVSVRSAIANQRRIRVESHFKPPSIEELRAILVGQEPQSAADVQAIVLDALDELNGRLRGDPTNPVNNFYADDGTPREENACRDQMLIALGALPYTISFLPEVAAPQAKRSDAAFSYGHFRVPLEAKRQWHRELWNAASSQLDLLYASDHAADGKGIYVVFWFGPNVTGGRRMPRHPEGQSAPTSPQKLEAMLQALLPAGRDSDIAIIVLDCTRPAKASKK